LVQVEKKRTALLLYAILVVLPAVVFGGLHWHQLKADHENRRQSIPVDAASAASRVRAGIVDFVAELLREQMAVEYYEYRPLYLPKNSPDRLTVLRSALSEGQLPEGVRAYFTYPFLEGSDAEFEFLAGPKEGTAWEQERLEMSRVLEVLASVENRVLLQDELLRTQQVLRADRDDPQSAFGVGRQYPHEQEIPLGTVALNLSPERDLECLEDGLEHLGEWANEHMRVRLSNFKLLVLRLEDGSGPYVLARRHVLIDLGEHDLSLLHTCFPEVYDEVHLSQGFFLDPEWLFKQVPETVARRVLDYPAEQLYLGVNAILPPPGEVVTASFDLRTELDVYASDERDYSLLGGHVGLKVADLERRFRTQASWFLGVAAMMIVSLGIGMALLVSSVSASFEEARRTENFVASVTHELRTPIAAVKMYGEMLKEGWVTTKEKKDEYLTRIVREANRLDLLIDRVLLKRRLATERPEPIPMDLNEEIEPQVPELKLTAGTYGGDLRFELAPDLPRILSIQGAVHAILVNLVENARKYAPVTRHPGGELEGEPILVRSRQERGRVYLEVADRGPGIPDGERSRIFEAFYRVGDERTRTKPGTGLGLHLVALQAEAMGARIEALDREGGGTIFRLTLKTA